MLRVINQVELLVHTNYEYVLHVEGDACCEDL